MPFGVDRIPSEVSWANLSEPDLFPSAIDLNSLDLEQAKTLRTWFVAHVDITPRKTSRRKPKSVSEDIQLSFL